MELPHTSKPIHQVSTFNHVLEHCIHIDCLSCFVCRERWNRNRRQPPSLKIQILNLISKASKPPLIMSINPTSLSCLAYALYRMITILRFYRIDEPIPLHDLSFVTVVSKPQS